MKTLATSFALLFSATTLFAQASVKHDSLSGLDTSRITDSVRTTSATPVPGPDALGNCVKLPGDFDRCHDDCWRRRR